MAHCEMQLISHLVRHGDLKQAIEWGIVEEDFHTDEARNYYTFLLGFLADPQNQNAQAGPNLFQSIHQNFEFCDDPNVSLQAYCKLVRRSRLTADIRAYAHNLSVMVETEDPVAAASAALDQLRSVVSLGYSTRTDVTFADAMERIVQNYQLKEEGVDLSVAKFPWARWNEVTGGGIQADDYIVFYGRPKSKKSWVLSYLVSSMYNQQKRPLIYTKEMTPDNIFQRIAACIAVLPYQEMRSGALEEDEKRYLLEVKDMAREMQAHMVCLSGRDAPKGGDTIEWLFSKADKHNSDIIIIDGLYLMSDSGTKRNQKDNIRVQNISRAAREHNLNSGIPIIATMQATRAAAAHNNAELDEIAYSDAIGQDATLAVRVINDKLSPTITLAVGGSREYEFDGCRINGVPATNFTWKEELSERDIRKAKERDADSGTDVKNKPSGNAKPSDKASLKRREDRLVDNTLRKVLS